MKIKKKLRDVTKEEFKDWKNINCLIGGINCSECPFYKVSCGLEVKDSWVFNKDVYSDKFLDQTIEVEAPDILDKEEKEYLTAVIKPFRNRVVDITKYNTGERNEYQYIRICVESVNHSKPSGCYANDCICLPSFCARTKYINMEVNKNYKLEELGL